MSKLESKRDVESESLLPGEDVGRYRVPRSSKNYFFSRKSAVIHFLIFISYIAASTVAIVLFQSRRPWDLVYSPATSSVNKYDVVTFNGPLNGNSVYRGEPREELHAAWRELLQYHNIRVPKSDLDRINRTSILLEDEEGGHLVTIEAIHHLHCLNQLRQQIYHEYYYPDVSEWNSTKGFHHVDHCIDILRQVLMCQGDVSLLTYSWIEGYGRPWPDFSVDHTCRDWNTVMDWASEHHIPNEKMRGPILMHPQLGPAYPNDEPENNS